MHENLSLNEIEQRIDEIVNQLSKLSEEKSRLDQLKLSKEQEHSQQIFQSWNISVGSNLICIARDINYYYQCIIRTIKVVKIDEKHQYIDVILCNYAEDDENNHYVSVQKNTIHFSTLEDIENMFRIYLVDSEQAQMIHSLMLNLDIDYKNLADKEKEIKYSKIIAD